MGGPYAPREGERKAAAGTRRCAYGWLSVTLVLSVPFFGSVART